MLVERCEFTVRQGQEDAFAETLTSKAVPLLEDVTGVRTVRWGRGVEAPDKFLLLVEWQDMAAHEAFRTEPANGELNKLLVAHVGAGAMEHFIMR